MLKTKEKCEEREVMIINTDNYVVGTVKEINKKYVYILVTR